MDFMTFVRNQRDRVGAWCSVGLGAIVLLLGWVGVSGTPFPAEQIPYIVSGGLGGLFLLGFGALLWLSADLRDEWRKLDAIEDLLRQGTIPEAVRGDGGSRANGAADERVAEQPTP
jgi:hypothetical protein